MPFTPYRPAQPYALINITNGSTINAAALNGISNAMRYLVDVGRQPITASGARVNGRVIPIVGYAYPDSGQYRIARKSVVIPCEVAPGTNRFCLFYTFRLNPVPLAFAPYLANASLQIDLIKAGAVYPLALAEMLATSPPLYGGSELIIGKLPMELALSPVDTEQLYIRLSYDPSGGQDTLIDNNTHATPFPNFSNFWNGCGALSFATFRDCGNC